VETSRNCCLGHNDFCCRLDMVLDGSNKNKYDMIAFRLIAEVLFEVGPRLKVFCHANAPGLDLFGERNEYLLGYDR
jgi:hypothetical protein